MITRLSGAEKNNKPSFGTNLIYQSEEVKFALRSAHKAAASSFSLAHSQLERHPEQDCLVLNLTHAAGSNKLRFMVTHTDKNGHSKTKPFEISSTLEHIYRTFTGQIIK
jgi:hypothetical protein